jgi:hypothetical protein
MDALPEIAAAGGPILIRAEVEEALRYARNEKASTTRRAYRTDFDLFRARCHQKGERKESELTA